MLKCTIQMLPKSAFFLTLSQIINDILYIVLFFVYHYKVSTSDQTEVVVISFTTNVHLKSLYRANSLISNLFINSVYMLRDTQTLFLVSFWFSNNFSSILIFKL